MKFRQIRQYVGKFFNKYARKSRNLGILESKHFYGLLKIVDKNAIEIPCRFITAFLHKHKFEKFVKFRKIYE